jgi:hypothetical protein
MPAVVVFAALLICVIVIALLLATKLRRGKPSFDPARLRAAKYKVDRVFRR